MCSILFPSVNVNGILCNRGIHMYSGICRSLIWPAVLSLELMSNYNFCGWVTNPIAQPPTWRTSGLLFVWPLPVDLTGLGGSAKSLRLRPAYSSGHSRVRNLLTTIRWQFIKEDQTNGSTIHAVIQTYRKEKSRPPKEEMDKSSLRSRNGQKSNAWSRRRRWSGLDLQRAHVNSADWNIPVLLF
jgi:hypothetical protein